MLYSVCARHGRDALCLLWEHYCTSLAHCPNTDRQAAAGTPSRNSPASLSLCSPPPPALQLYHARLLEMSWSEWVPALTHIDGMQAVSTRTHCGIAACVIHYTLLHFSRGMLHSVVSPPVWYATQCCTVRVACYIVWYQCSSVEGV